MQTRPRREARFRKKEQNEEQAYQINLCKSKDQNWHNRNSTNIQSRAEEHIYIILIRAYRYSTSIGMKHSPAVQPRYINLPTEFTFNQAHLTEADLLWSTDTGHVDQVYQPVNLPGSVKYR